MTANGKFMCKNNDITASIEKSNTKKLRKRSFFCVLYCFLAIVLSGILIFCGYCYWFYSVRELPPPPDVEKVKSYLQNGDIILRRGVGFWSELFRKHNPKDKRFSHAGIVMIDENGEYFVIHSVGNDFTGQGAVAIEPLEKFVQELRGLGVSRLQVADADILVDNAKKYVNLPFDWKFNSDDSSAIYCTELIDVALRDISPNFALTRTKDNMIFPDSCLDKRFFIEIDLSDLN